MGESPPNVLSGAEARLLSEIGFLACGAGNVKAARLIFQGLRKALSDPSTALIGLAMSYLEAGSPQEAVSLLRNGYNEISAKDPEYTVFFGLCLFASGHQHEAEEILSQLRSEIQGSSAAGRLADAFLKSAFRNNKVLSVLPAPARVRATN